MENLFQTLPIMFRFDGLCVSLSKLQSHTHHISLRLLLWSMTCGSGSLPSALFVLISSDEEQILALVALYKQWPPPNFICTKRINLKVKCIMMVKYDSTMSWQACRVASFRICQVTLWNSALRWHGSSSHHQHVLCTWSHPVRAKYSSWPSSCVESLLIYCNVICER